MKRIGIDVGGTNTDAVLMDGDLVLASTKASTTSDVVSGVEAAIRAVLASSGSTPDEIAGVMIGTTHFTNAFVVGRDLSSVAAVRLGLPATTSYPPMIDWPDRARDIVHVESFMCHGGSEVDGRPISLIDPAELRHVAQKIGEAGLTSVAITGVYSPVDPSCELEAAEIISSQLPGVHVSLSHEIGRMGLLERENATIINATLRDLGVHVVDAFERAVLSTGITAEIFLCQNDGTLGSLAQSAKYPVGTFTAGPTNSMRGAGFLSGISNCTVVDVGGTTSDIGVLNNGFPRESALDVRVGGVRTNFRLPDVVSLAIGGGSMVDQGETVRVGPDTVAREIATRAMVFGGDVLTATDLAVAAGRMDAGDKKYLAHLERRIVEQGLQWISDEVADAVDRMRTSRDPLAVVLVGGGHALVPDDLAGVDKVVRPDHLTVANAIGAAISQVSGSYDKIVALEGQDRSMVLEQAKDEARDLAVASGARAGSVEIVDVEEVPVAYLPGRMTRLTVKAVGDLDLEARHAQHH